MGAGAGGDYWESRVEAGLPAEDDAADLPLRNPLGTEGAVLPEGEAQLRHIFRPDHLIEDNPETREKIINYTRSDEHYVGRDEELGHLWYADTKVDNNQFWVEVRERTVKEAGINLDERPFDVETGLRSNPRKNGMWRGGKR